MNLQHRNVPRPNTHTNTNRFVTRHSEKPILFWESLAFNLIGPTCTNADPDQLSIAKTFTASITYQHNIANMPLQPEQSFQPRD